MHSAPLAECPSLWPGPEQEAFEGLAERPQCPGFSDGRLHTAYPLPAACLECTWVTRHPAHPSQTVLTGVLEVTTCKGEGEAGDSP